MVVRIAAPIVRMWRIWCDGTRRSYSACAALAAISFLLSCNICLWGGSCPLDRRRIHHDAWTGDLHSTTARADLRAFHLAAVRLVTGAMLSIMRQHYLAHMF